MPTYKNQVFFGFYFPGCPHYMVYKKTALFQSFFGYYKKALYVCGVAKNKQLNAKTMADYKKGGLLDETYQHEIAQAYEGGFGYAYHEYRTDENDAELEIFMEQRNMRPAQKAAFIVSRMGRHYGDSIGDKADPRCIDWFLKEFGDQDDMMLLDTFVS